NACSFLDFLEDKGMIRHELTRARIGQFVLLSGRLTLLDLNVAKSLWNVTQLQELMMQGIVAGMNAGKATNGRQQADKESRNNAKMMFSLLERMPHGLQMR